MHQETLIDDDFLFCKIFTEGFILFTLDILGLSSASSDLAQLLSDIKR